MRPAAVTAYAADLHRRGEPFAVVTVIRREAPSSAQVGNKAVITADGTLRGWLGGSCTQPTAIRQALEAIRTGTPRIVALSPDPATDHRPGIVAMPLTCHSGGAVDLYIEPVLPATQLVVFGSAPVARAAARIGAVLGHAVTVVDPEAEAHPDELADAERVVAELDTATRDRLATPGGSRTFAIVATMGDHDETALRDALSLDADYVGLVASQRRFAEVKAVVAPGVSDERLQRVRSPAGLDIGATTPEEIALSILAEIVTVARSRGDTAGPDEAARPAEATDPICGMTVDVATAKHTFDHEGQTYYFCCGGCRERFSAAPAEYAHAAAVDEDHG